LAIASAFRLLVSQKSNEKVTVSMIAEQCGISRKTFYYHFSDENELLQWIFRSDLSDCLIECCDKEDLVYLPAETRINFPEYPYFARTVTGIRRLDCSQFYFILADYLEKNKAFYKYMLSRQAYSNFIRYVIKLYQQSFTEDIRYVLGGRRLPPATIEQLSWYFSNVTVANYFDAALNSNHDLRKTLPKEFANILHESLSYAIDNFFSQKKNTFSFFDTLPRIPKD
jgi:AcrR family transcriptional regulator